MYPIIAVKISSAELKMERNYNGSHLCMYESALWLNDHVIALPVEYV